MHIRAGLEGELLIQGHGRIHIGIAVHTAETHEFRVLKARHLAEADCLRGIGQLGLAAHQIEHRLVPVLGAKLKQRERTPPGARICEAHRLERTEGQRLLAARGKRLHGHTALKMLLLLKFAAGDLLAVEQALIKRLVLVFVHGTVQIIALARLAVAGAPESDAHINGIRRHDGRDGIIKIEVLRADGPCNGRRQAFARQRPG